jgi:hypothetical protein
MEKLLTDIGELLKCPISNTKMLDPISLPCGHVYDRHGLEESFKIHRSSSSRTKSSRILSLFSAKYRKEQREDSVKYCHVCKFKFKRVSDTKTNFILRDLLKLIDKQGFLFFFD